MLKSKLYTWLARFYVPNELHPIYEGIARLLEKVFGYATFNYAGVKLQAGPLGFLDNYIIRGININPYLTSAVSQYLKNGGVFLDVGANHGVFSLIAAKNPKVKVFAFEPSPRELVRLWSNLRLNPGNNISVLAYGLGDHEISQALMLTDNENPGMNSLPAIRQKGKLSECHFAPLPALLSAGMLRQTRLCKLDIEGQEMLVLQALKPHMPLLRYTVFVIEMSPLLLPKIGKSIEDIYNFFAEAGFIHQFGMQAGRAQWEEVFYHPAYNERPQFQG